MIDYLTNVYGLEHQKQEINNLINWFINDEEYSKKGYKVPRGLLLYGSPGNGKSLIISEIEKALKDNDKVCFKVFESRNENDLNNDLNQFFDSLDNNKKYFLAIDELDLLLDDNDILTRTLQEKLDGIEKKKISNVFILAACNKINNIPYAIKRAGRFDRKIEIEYPSKKEIIHFINSLEKKLNFKLDQSAENFGIYDLFLDNSYVEIKAVINDCLIRFGSENCTYQNLVYCYNCLENSFDKMEASIPDSTYIHEAGHCVMALAFKDLFDINKLIINIDKSYVSVSNKVNVFSYETQLAKIMTSYAGSIAEKLIAKTSSLGIYDDLNRARETCYNLINCEGYKGGWVCLPPVGEYDIREETLKKRRHNEIIIERILKKLEKETTKFLKKHKNLIVEIARKAKVNNYLNKEEIKNILQDYEIKNHIKVIYKKIKAKNYSIGR